MSDEEEAAANAPSRGRRRYLGVGPASSRAGSRGKRPLSVDAGLASGQDQSPTAVSGASSGRRAASGEVPNPGRGSGGGGGGSAAASAAAGGVGGGAAAPQPSSSSLSTLMGTSLHAPVASDLQAGPPLSGGMGGPSLTSGVAPVNPSLLEGARARVAQEGASGSIAATLLQLQQQMHQQQLEMQQRTQSMESSLMGMSSWWQAQQQAAQVAMDFQKQQWMRSLEAQQSAQAAVMARQQEAMARQHEALMARLEALSVAPSPARGLSGSLALFPSSLSLSASIRSSPAVGGGGTEPAGVADEVSGAAGPQPLWRTVAGTYGKGAGAADLTLLLRRRRCRRRRFSQRCCRLEPWRAPRKEPVWVLGVDVEGARWMMSRKKLSFTSPASHPLSTGQADPDM